MSNIKVRDKRGGTYQATIEFSYGECERLPYNILRRIKAAIEVVSDGGIRAIANFNIRTPADSAAFLEILEMFGEDGSFIHGSAADSDALARLSPPDAAHGCAIADDDDMELEGTLHNSK